MAAQKENRGPTKPSKPLSAFAHFCNAYVEHLKLDGEILDPASFGFTIRCRGSWSRVTEDQKVVFMRMAEKDKKRYQLEMEEYRQSRLRLAEERKKAAEEKKKAMKVKNRNAPKKVKKDPNAPRKPLRAFDWFRNEERPKVKNMHPELKFGEISNELGRLWKVASVERRNRYHALAERDKTRFQRELAAYTNSQTAGSMPGRRQGNLLPSWANRDNSQRKMK